MRTVRLLIKEGPAYLAAFAALLTAMASTGWLDRIFPPQMEPIAALIEPADEPMLGSPLMVSPEPWWDVRVGGDAVPFLPATDTFPEETMAPAGVRADSLLDEVEPVMLEEPPPDDLTPFVLAFLIGGTVVIGWAVNRVLFRRA